eukprot:CAMPEP_0117010384 /NCGR_PEP_ID=MMETSP0472-20121206/9163_1 /TAXON_ID=693140 ORGANISM="Tiarina fusus, Strain LIS" /NCGR_SAMPLE_ID=MMETSP0472 /ASSEMBLY_ACC=CAM_ASM_000603 /LENGTH=62 /DNA_ID=CAMNT_0004712897 /DNA_START=72 /DNA_END=256 /DNA_ORIENTATION=-
MSEAILAAPPVEGEARHILHNSDDRKLNFAAKIDFLADVEERHFLWCRHDDGAVDFAGAEQL